MFKQVDKNGKALVSDFGISIVTGASDYNYVPKEYESVHYCGKPIYESKAFEELNVGGGGGSDATISKYSSKFDVVYYGIMLWKILTR